MNSAHFHFAQPEWLWFILFAPLLIVLLHRHSARMRRKQLTAFAATDCLKVTCQAHSPARRLIKEGMLLLAVIFAGLALARPQWGAPPGLDAFSGEDVLFVLDCSQSMAATDSAPNRLQRAKFAILDYMTQRNHGRLGLVAFAGSAFLQCPLTFDMAAFEEALMGVDNNTIPVPGTDIGRALDEASRAMDSRAKRKMVVLLTDGEDLEKTGIAAAHALATNGVVVFSIGVGTPAGKEIQMQNAAGQMDFLRDSEGQIIKSRLDETTLHEIARATSGSYFPLGRSGEGLQQMNTAMHTIETLSAEQRVLEQGIERYYLPLAIMLALATTEPLLGTRKKTIARPGIKSPPIRILAGIVLGGTFCLPADAASTNAPQTLSARAYYNAGTRFLTTSNYEEAERLLTAALASQDDKVREAAIFNLAHARFAEGEALLSKGPAAQKLFPTTRQTIVGAQAATQAANAALAGQELDRMLAAYQAGRGARRELRSAERAIKSAMETYGKTLNKWQRAADDFTSAAELNSTDTNAQQNAKIVARQMAMLIDSLRESQQMMGAVGEQKQQLSQALKKLKGNIPETAGSPGGKNEEDEDEGEDVSKEVKPDSLAGKEEQSGHIGEQMKMPISPDQAARTLDELPVDGTRQLPLANSKQAAASTEKNGRTW